MSTTITNLYPYIDFYHYNFIPVTKTLFFDIETTGFSPTSTSLYLIGGSYFVNNEWKLIQWFCEDSSQEAAALEDFMDFISRFQVLVSYNGLGFDIPYLKAKCQMYDIPFQMERLRHIDLYKAVTPYRNLFKLENLKQKTLEQYMDISRIDTLSGRELISVYQDYRREPRKSLRDILSLHNKEDIMGLIAMIPILSYQHFFLGNFSVTGVIFDTHPSYEENKPEKEIIFEMTCHIPLPRRVSFACDDFYFTGYRKEARLKAALYEGELKYYYSNYRDYYFLPQEDMAIHKSVAFFVDKDFRTKARPANCYSRKTGLFLPQYDEIVSPYLKADYGDTITYFELSNEFTDTVSLVKKYILHVFRRMLRQGAEKA